MATLQLEDPVIGPVLQAKNKSKQPTDDNLSSYSRHTRRLFQIWEQLVVIDNKLYRRFLHQSTNMTHLQLVLPRCKQDVILQEMHEGILGGHLGVDKTLGRLHERYYWPGYHDQVVSYCATCPQCEQRKTPRVNQAPLNSIKVGSPMQPVAVDILGPFPETENGNRYILCVADYFTRWSEAFAIPNQEVSTVAKVLTQEVFFRFSPPEQLHSDQGKQFESQLLLEVCKLLGIAKSRTTPYHPQSDGVVERFNRTLLSMLATAAKDYPFDWQSHLRPLCMAYNTKCSTHYRFLPVLSYVWEAATNAD